MKYESYGNFKIADHFRVFDFVSVGVKGSIRKRVKFTLIEEPDIYNLAFGDITPDDDIDDYSITDNRDMVKILATVAIVTEAFLQRFPKRTVTFRGSTDDRTRLYRMAIGNNLEELSETYRIYGITEDENIVPFEKNGTYIGFVVRLK